MKRRLLLAIIFLIFSAGNAHAITAWSSWVHNMAVYTPDADTPSPTLWVGHCLFGASIVLLDTATTFTGTLQTCNVPIAYGVASTTGTCQDYHGTPLDSGGSYGETEVIASYIRLGVITGSGTGIAVVTCKK